MADDLSLAPLVITPDMVASQARAREAEANLAPQYGQSPAPAGEFDPVSQLQAMFPDYDREVLSSVFSISGSSMESAIGQLLAMSDPAAAAREEAAVESSASDEELAMALFKQFAEELENQLDTPIPPEVRNDPMRYEAFIREQFERELGREGSSLTRRAADLFDQNSGGISSDGRQQQHETFLDRVMRGLRSNRSVAVDQGAAPLLLSDHNNQEGAERV